MTLQYNSTITLNEIRDQSPCADGWQKLLTHLGKTKPDDEPLSLLTVLESNGLDDAIWCLQCKSLERLSRHFQAWCAEQVLHIFESKHPDDMRVRYQIAMLRNDSASDEDRRVAWGDARAAVRDAARGDAMVAACDAASVAACDAAWAAAWDASMVAVRDASMVAASDAAWAAACDAQEEQLRKMIKEEKSL